jgi:hypothetical protein
MIMLRSFWLLLFPFSLFSAESVTPLLTGEPIGSASFLPVYHWPIGFYDRDNTITLEDGSVWRVEGYRSIFDWRDNDPLTITVIPEGWFTKARYQITNHNERVHPIVTVSLLKRPILNGEYTRQVLSFEQSTCVITLTDQSRWQLSAQEYEKCFAWRAGDILIIATSPNARPSFKVSVTDCLLINTNLNNYIKATLTGCLYGSHRDH